MAKDEIGLVIRLENGKIVTEQLKGVEEQSKKTEKNASEAFGNIKTGWIAMVAGVVAAGATLKKSFDFADASSRFQQASIAMEKQFGVSSSAVLKRLDEVAQGTISKADLLAGANRAFALNVTKDVDQLAKLLEIARLRAQAMGISSTQAFDDLVTGIGRASPMILDNLGIITKGWDKEAAAVGKSVDAQFILQKVLQDGDRQLKDSGGIVETNAQKFERFNASLKDLGIQIGNSITPMLTGLTDKFKLLKNEIELLQQIADRGRLEKLTPKEAAIELEKLVRAKQSELEIAIQKKELGAELSDKERQDVQTLAILYSKINGLKKEEKITTEQLFGTVERFAGEIKKEDKLRADKLKKQKEEKDIADQITAYESEVLEDQKKSSSEVAEANKKIAEVRRISAIVAKEEYAITHQTVEELEKEKQIKNEINEKNKKQQDEFNSIIGKSVQVTDAVADASGKIGDALSSAGGEATKLGTAINVVSKYLKIAGNLAVAFTKGTVDAVVAVIGAVAEIVTDVINAEVTYKKFYEEIEKSDKEHYDNLKALDRDYKSQKIQDDIKNANETYTREEEALRRRLGLIDIENGIREAQYKESKKSLEKQLAEETDLEKKEYLKLQLDKLDADKAYAEQEKVLRETRDAEILRLNNEQKKLDKESKLAALDAQRAQIEASFEVARANALALVGGQFVNGKWVWNSDAATAKINASAATVLSNFDATRGKIASIQAFAQGGDFVTNGPQLIKVGDNASGRERVTITPSEKPNMNSGMTITSMTVIANSPREFFDQMQRYQRQNGVL